MNLRTALLVLIGFCSGVLVSLFFIDIGRNSGLENKPTKITAATQKSARKTSEQTTKNDKSSKKSAATVEKDESEEAQEEVEVKKTKEKEKDKSTKKGKKETEKKEKSTKDKSTSSKKKEKESNTNTSSKGKKSGGKAKPDDREIIRKKRGVSETDEELSKRPFVDPLNANVPEEKLPLVCNDTYRWPEMQADYTILTDEDIIADEYPCFWANYTHWALDYYYKVPDIKICTHDPEVDKVISQSLHEYGFWGGPDDHMIALRTGPCTKDRPYILDIGANIGLFTLLGAAKECHVVAFEPLYVVMKCIYIVYLYKAENKLHYVV